MGISSAWKEGFLMVPDGGLHNSDSTTYPPGQWVEFTCAAFIEPDHIIINGMLGVVLDHPQSRYICTPGVSTMIRVAGSDVDYGYFNEWFVPLNRIPDDRELVESGYLWENAFPILEHVYGYTGFVQLGNKIIPQEKLLQEITATSEHVVRWLQEGGSHQEMAGNMKRIRKVLRAFSNHPDGKVAEGLAESMEGLADHASILDALSGLKRWAAKAVNEERLEMQSERITQARKRGNAILMPFKGRDGQA